MTEDKPKKKRGAQPGNQNARKHGFYSRYLDYSLQGEITQAAGVKGLDAEIALLRVKIKTMLKKDPYNFKVLIKGMETLARLIKAKHSLPDDGSKLENAARNVIENFAQQLGINTGDVKGEIQTHNE
jgi:hypothetical protein